MTCAASFLDLHRAAHASLLLQIAPALPSTTIEERVMGELSGFWIVGIVVNVTLTGLALFWIFRQMKPRPRSDEQQD
jgi:hypothetical protein